MPTSPKLDAGDPVVESKNPDVQFGRKSNSKPWWYKALSFLLVASLLGLGYWTQSRWEPILESWIRPAAANRPKPRPPVVSIAEAKIESIPQFINCLGTVTAFNSVTVKSRVDGELVEVAFQEGQMIQEGQLLARIDARSFEAALNQAKGQLQRDLAALELAKLNVDRSKNLPTGGTLSQQERDELDAVYKQAQALVDVDRALVANAQLQVAYCNIIAPIGGRVGLRQVAFDRTFQNKLAEGTLSAIDNQVDPTTGTLRLKANFENTQGLLFPNQFVNIRLLVKQWADAIVIPSSAVQRGADFQYVYVVQSDNETVDIAKVQVAFSEAGRSVISQGLSGGDRVVIEGTDKLQPKGKISLPGAGPKPR